MSARPRWGIDGAWRIASAAVAGIACAAAAAWLYGGPADAVPLDAGQRRVVAVALGIAALCLLCACALLLYAGTRLRSVERDRVLDAIEWRGDELVLAVGGGRGLYAVGAAGRLTRGTATALDAKRARARDHARAAAVLENARRAGREGRVAVRAADIADPPFTAGSFDVVVCGRALRGRKSVAARRAALEAMVRVLKPDGSLGLAELRRRDECAATLVAAGLRDVEVRAGGARNALLRIVSFGAMAPFTLTGRKAPPPPPLPSVRERLG